MEIANRSNFADSFGSGFVVTGPGWIYESPAYYAQKLYARADGSYPLSVERSAAQTWPQQQPDITATLSADGKQLHIYSVNATPQTLPIHFRMQGFPATAAAGSVYTLEDHENGLTAEVMNSRDDPGRVSVTTRPVPVSGGTFDFSFKPFTLTLLELKLAK